MAELTYDKATADELFMKWLREYDDSWEVTYGGTIVDMYAAWLAGREQGDEDHRWDCADS